jgi:hypothetical protein
MMAKQETKAGPPAQLFEVEIPNCLLGRLTVEAENEADALEKYKATCGIRSHRQPARVTRIEAPQVTNGDVPGKPDNPPR